MKIILSPSKTQSTPSVDFNDTNESLLNRDKTLRLFHGLKRLSKSKLAEIMDLDGKLLEKTHGLYQSFDPDTVKRIPAIRLYTGLVYDQLHLDEYDSAQWVYLNDHLRLLSAMYGLLHPMTLVWPYRLDYTMRLPKIKLKDLWAKEINQALKDEDWIIDLSSQEFGSLLKPLSSKIHQVVFLEIINGQEKIISANAKKARGKMADYLIRNKVTQHSELITFNQDGYRYLKDRSDEKRSVFVKETAS